ncbi:MAG TPA: DUF4307 domain-containing protein [Nocardioidaceae bacterium]|nr:DUF4307 domain-containing protein [Nocardioidaceae bacterium]
MSDRTPDLAERYGGPRPAGRRLVVALAAILLAAGLAWVVWASVFAASPRVSSQLVSFDVAGEHAVHARITVVRSSPSVRASCLLQAVATDHSVVGEIDVEVGPGGATTSTLTRSLRTDRRATSVELKGCLAPGQRQRR